MSSVSPQAGLSRALGYRVFACMAFAYIFSHGMRVINSVIAPELTAELNLTNTELGSLTSAYFLGFAVAQLPLGVLLDRFGSRRVHCALLMVAALGCTLFSISDSLVGLWIGRALIGMGFAAGLMASLRLYRFWFPADRQQQLVALMLVAGTAGALSATVPVRWLMPYVGWRGLFAIVAGAIVLSSVIIFLLIPRNENYSRGTGWLDSLRGYGTIYSDPFLWRVILTSVIIQGGFVACQTLWAGPWFTKVLGMTPEGAAQSLFILNTTLMFAYLALSSLVRVFARRGWSLLRVTSVASVGVIALHLVLTTVTDPRLGIALWLLWAVFSVTFTPVQAWVCMTFPDKLAGRALTAYNLVVFGGVFAVQWFFGALIDWCITWSATEPEGFRNAMRIWIGIEVVAILWMWLFRPRPYNERLAAT